MGGEQGWAGLMSWAEVGPIPRAEAATEGLGAAWRGQSHRQRLQEGPRLALCGGQAMVMAAGLGHQLLPFLTARRSVGQLGS